MSAEKTPDRASPPESLLQGDQKRVEFDPDSPLYIEARVVKTKGGIVFAGGASDQLYELIPEYQGRHRYDPTAEQTEEEEKKLVKKECLIKSEYQRITDIWRNKKRDAVWDAMSPEEEDTYLATTKDQGSRRLDFRFAH